VNSVIKEFSRKEFAIQNLFNIYSMNLKEILKMSKENFPLEFNNEFNEDR
jgi:hypothetical protein